MATTTIRIGLRTLVGVLVASMLATAVLIGFPTRAGAATVDGAITNVTTTPADPGLFDELTTTLAWRVPDSADAGDTFSMTLPPQLNQLPAGFQLTDSTGEVVANAVIDAATHVVTFTLTAFAQSHDNVAGTALFTSHLDSTLVSPGQTVPLAYTTDGGRTVFTNTVTVGDSPGTDRSRGQKYGEFARADQGDLDPTDALLWRIESPGGPFDSTRMIDHAGAGQLFDCAAMSAAVGNYGGPDNNFVSTGAYTGYTVNACTTTDLNVTFPAMTTDDGGYQLTVPTTITDLDAVSFADTATVQATVDGVTSTNATSNVVRQGTAGGRGSGSLPTPGVTLAKSDAAGHTADTAADAATLATGRAALVFTVRNSGEEALTHVSVTDTVDSLGNGTVTGLSCDWSRYGGPATGAGWAGPLPRGATVTCTATLAGVRPAPALHQDTGTVRASGLVSGTPVRATNPYYAAAPVTPASTVPSPAPTAAGPTSTVAAPTVTATDLAATGSRTTGLLGAALAALVGGGVLLVLARPRHGPHVD